MKQKVLFICTHNSARSQIAETLINKLYGNHYEAFSAGTEPRKINPYVVKVMKEVDIDLLEKRTKSVNEFKGIHFDFVVTVCDEAKEACPFFSGAKKYIHQSFEDPSTFSGSEEEILSKTKQVRDEIRDWIEITFRGIDE